jgi:murein DD-endopeptidase MepM/ murein hydrolase activator NlpD
MKEGKSAWLVGLAFIVLLHSCTIVNFQKKSPHEQYAERLLNAGLNHSALGERWLQQAESSLRNPVHVKLPYSETGYFSAERVRAIALCFSVQRGEQIVASVNKNTNSDCRLYLDLLQFDSKASQPGENVAYSDTAGSPIIYEVEESGEYCLRLQPELLCPVEYTLTITSGPSLGFPLPANQKTHYAGFFGDDREKGGRKHEGVDIVGSFRTPIIAVAPGIITAVNENPLGGKAIWLRPSGKNYTVYYAHLDTQIVHTGQLVKQGDTLGLEGNTGNAKSTVAHLHFGIYSGGGAIDPLPFINREIKKVPSISAPLTLLNDTVRTFEKLTRTYTSPDEKSEHANQLSSNTPMLVESATKNWYFVTLPDHEKVFIRSNKVQKADEPLRSLTLSTNKPLFDSPDSLAAKKKIIKTGQAVAVNGSFESYYLVKDATGETGWINK